MSAFFRSDRQGHSRFVCALSGAILVLGLALAAPAAHAGMGGAGGGAGAASGGAGASAGAAAGGGGGGGTTHRLNDQTELTACHRGMVWDGARQKCLARRSRMPPGPRP